jgi:hypothetical protein
MTGAHNTRRTESRERVSLSVLATSVAELHMEAELRNVPFARLCARLLEIIAQDANLLENVLDGEMKRKKGSV